MSFWKELKIKKTRKDHYCVCCGIKIPKGSACTYSAGVFDLEGEFQYYYVCDRCMKWVEDNGDRLDSSGYYWEEVADIMWNDFHQNCQSSCLFWDFEIDDCGYIPSAPAACCMCDKFQERGAIQ